MPDTPPTTLIHFRNPAAELRAAVCGQLFGVRTSDPGEVTCFACRKTEAFKQAQFTTPVKLSGVMQQHPIMAELYAEALKRGEDVPRYLHDCSDCEYLGRTSAVQPAELYWCHAPEEGNVLARFSSDPSDYHSGLSAAQTDPNLAQAVVRAIHKGLFAANALHFL